MATKSDTVGVPSAADRCTRPVSTPTTSSARAMSPASASSGCRGGTRAADSPAREPLAAHTLVVRSPWQQHHEARARKRADQRAPVRLRPRLVGAARRVKEDHVRPFGHHAGAAEHRRDEPETSRAFGAIAEGGSGELPAAVDQVLVRLDRVMNVVRKRGNRLANAGAVRTVAHAARESRDQRAFDLLLQIENGAVALAAQIVAEARQLPPRRRMQKLVAPSSKRDGHDAANAAIERDERSEALFDHPIDGGPRSMCADIGDERRRMDDVSERRRAHDENRVGCAHASSPRASAFRQTEGRARGQRRDETP